MVDLIFEILLGVCILLLVCSFVILCAKHNKLFFKIYLYIFEREEYNAYKEIKNILKSGGSIPVCSAYTKTDEMKGFYFLVLNSGTGLWKDSKPVLVDFHKILLEELFELGNIRESIENTRNADIQYKKEIIERIAQLEKEIAEGKERLAKMR